MTSSRKERMLEVARHRQSGVVLVLEDVHDPHNAAAIMRTADALGIQHVWLIFEKEELWNPRRVGKSTSSSANKWLTFRTFTATTECVTALAADKYISIAAVVDGDVEISSVLCADYERIALWVGNENRGLSASAQGAATIRARIPMRGMVGSLNVSVAAALFLYEIVRNRRIFLSESESRALAEEWTKR